MRKEIVICKEAFEREFYDFPMKRIISVLVSLLLVAGFTEAYAAETVADRATSVEMIKSKYIPTLEDQHATLLQLRKTMKVDAGLLKQVNSVIADFDSNYAAILKGLNDPNQAIQPIIDLCEEEVEEFGNSIYQLKLMAAKIKSITCIKGKSSKKIVGLAPKCPAGYKKK